MLMLYLAAGQAARSMIMLGRLGQHVRRSVNRDQDDHDEDLLSEGSFESAQVRDKPEGPVPLRATYSALLCIL